MLKQLVDKEQKKKYLAPKITLPIGHFLLVPRIKKKKILTDHKSISLKNKIEDL